MIVLLLFLQKQNLKNALSFASPEIEKYYLFIYEVITWGKRKKTVRYSVVNTLRCVQQN